MNRLLVTFLLLFVFACSADPKFQMRQKAHLQSEILAPHNENLNDERGTISEQDTVIFGKITVLSHDNQNITQNCYIQLAEKGAAAYENIYRDLYKQTAFLKYSNIAQNGLYAVKTSRENVKLSYIECSTASYQKQSLNLQLTNIHPDKKYYFGDITVHMGKFDDKYRVENKFKNTLNDFHKSIPTAESLKSKKRIVISFEKQQKRELKLLNKLIKNDKAKPTTQPLTKASQ